MILRIVSCMLIGNIAVSLNLILIIRLKFPATFQKNTKNHKSTAGKNLYIPYTLLYTPIPYIPIPHSMIPYTYTPNT